MRIIFNIEYFTEFGQNICMIGNVPELGSWDDSRAARMDYVKGGQWRMELFLDHEKINDIEYKFILKDDRNQSVLYEWGKNRKLRIKEEGFFSIYLRDYWRISTLESNPLFTAAFTGNLWKRDGKGSRARSRKHFNHRFQLYAPRIDEDHNFCIIGNEEGLGQWNPERAVIMEDTDYPLWKVDVFLEGTDKPIQYKYGIFDKKTNKMIGWEEGNNRSLDHDLTVIDNCLVINTDLRYRHPQGRWRGSGVALPVFSLRTSRSFGVGEFPDLKLLIDWAVKTNLKLIQILPINDTVAHHSWSDSYPYAAISVIALHPIYLNLPEMGTLKDQKEMNQFVKDGKKLNKNKVLDYENVMNLKSRFYKKLYDQERDHFLKDPEFKKFFKENQDWLEQYAAFSYLRDKYRTPDFTRWEEYAKYNKLIIDLLVDPKNKIHDDIAVHYFIQYHLHKQLCDVVEYARAKGVILKGDLPIGIYRNSVDAWVEPRLYHMDKQAGAPPDAYSITGQNWRFPTYNWEEMAKDDYAWWRSRLSQMAKYFDAYRIDHILGFFRIWEIPWESVEGLMGVFNPAIPMYRHEIEGRGIHFDYDRFCRPYIKDFMLHELFGEYRKEVIEEFLVQGDHDLYDLKPEFDTQHKVLEYFNAKEYQPEEVDKNNRIKYGIYTLIGNVLFFEEPGSNREAFHPKIAFHKTYSYKNLDDYQKNILNQIYTHYFYHRQEDFWRDQAMVKLPAITNSSEMLVCGEDLGMVPDCVPGVMHDLGILRLFIQRMPKETNGEFGNPVDAPYLSVVSPSCHDMSTVRGWWEQDHERSQRYYNQILGHHGDSPLHCAPWISEAVLDQHLRSPAMWAIIPLQDLVAIEPKLRRKNPKEEQINDPSNPYNLWQYRFHMNLEDLLKEDDFNQKLANLVEISGRSWAF
jgi:4-alpha-glucanotransferase